MRRVAVLVNHKQSSRYDFINVDFKNRQSSLSPNSKQTDRISTIVKKAKSRHRKIAIGEQILAYKASRKLPELDCPSAWTDKSIVSPSQEFEDSTGSKINRKADRNSLITTKRLDLKLKRRGDNNSVHVQDFEQTAKESVATKNSIENSNEYLTSPGFYSMIHEKPKGFKDKDRPQNHELMLKMKHKALLQIKRKAIRNSIQLTENS